MTPLADARSPQDPAAWRQPWHIAIIAVVSLVVMGGAAAAYLVLKRDSDQSCPPPCTLETSKGDKPPSHREEVKTVDWPLYGYDEQRTRYLPTKRVRPPFDASVWSFQAGKLLEFSPIVAKGTLYFQDKDAELYALSADKGKVEWRKEIGALGAASPAYSHGVIYVVTLQKAPGVDQGEALALRAQRRQAAVALRAARAQRDLADRRRQPRDRRQRVRRRLRAQPQGRQGRLAGAHRRGGQGRPRLRRRRPLRRQLRRPGVRDQGLQRLVRLAVEHPGPQLRPRRAGLLDPGRRLRPRLPGLDRHPRLLLRPGHRASCSGATRPATGSTGRRRSPTRRRPTRPSTSAPRTRTSTRSTRRRARCAGRRTPAGSSSAPPRCSARSSTSPCSARTSAPSAST